MESLKKAVPSRAITGMCKKIMATSLAMLLLFSLMPVSLLASADEHTVEFAADFDTAEANDVTATGVISETSVEEGTTATVTITLTGEATAAGIFSVGLTSANDVDTINIPGSVTKVIYFPGQKLDGTDEFEFTFEMPSDNVADLVVELDFVALSGSTAATIFGTEGWTVGNFNDARATTAFYSVVSSESGAVGTSGASRTNTLKILTAWGTNANNSQVGIKLSDLISSAGTYEITATYFIAGYLLHPDESAPLTGLVWGLTNDNDNSADSGKVKFGTTDSQQYPTIIPNAWTTTNKLVLIVEDGYDDEVILRLGPNAHLKSKNTFGVQDNNDAWYISSLSVTKLDTTAPTVGGSGAISTDDVTDTTLTLNWTAASDDVSAATALKYYVYQKTSAFTMSGGLPTDGTLLNSGGTANIEEYSVTGLTANSTYYFIVVVEDEAENKAAYTAVSETTAAGPTPSIASVTPSAGTITDDTYTFSGVTYGYAAGAAPSVTFTITNGPVELTGFSVTSDLDGGEFAFASSDTSPVTAADTRSFTITPEADLGAGTYTGTVTISANEIDDYTIDVEFVVAKKTITITGVAATDRAYNGTTTVAITGGTLVDVEIGDTVTPNVPTTGTIVDANAGASKAVTLAAITLSGADAGNYTLTPPTGITVNITKATLTPSVSTTGVSGKVYDDTTDITVGTPTITLAGRVGSENPTATADFAFSTADAGTSRAVEATDITLTGSWGDNYVLSSTTATSTRTFTITRAPISGSVTISVGTEGSDDKIIDEDDILTAVITGISPSGARSGLSYNWVSDDGTVLASTPSYTVASSDTPGTLIYVTVVGTGNYMGNVNSDPVEVGKEPLDGSISIDFDGDEADLTVGDILSLDTSLTNSITYPPSPYNIQWFRNGAAISGATRTTYTITTADLATNITVEIIGINNFTGTLSSAAVAISATAPGAVQNLTATEGDGQVTLTWTAPASNGGAAITLYQVSRDNGANWVTASSTTSHTFTGLTNGTEYTFAVRAVNSKGNGTAATAKATPVAPAPPPSAPTPFVTVEDYVAGLYLSILGRPYDQEGFDSWVAAIRSGAMTAAEVELAFMFSEEAQGLETFTNDELFIENLYKVILGRDYDSTGKSHWLAALESEAMSREEIYEAFTNSLEYEHLRAETYVKGLYEAALGREYDEGGLASWTDALKTGKITATELVRSFIFSDELLAQEQNDDTFVETLYKTFFGRASDTGGKTSWVGALTAGMARVDVFNSFASSQEFDYVCKAYGLVK